MQVARVRLPEIPGGAFPIAAHFGAFDPMARNLIPSNEPPPHMAPASPQLPVSAPDFSPVVADDEPEGVQWQRYVSALRRYKWLILLITLLGTGVGVVVTRFLKPEYQVQATIWIESPGRPMTRLT